MRQTGPTAAVRAAVLDRAADGRGHPRCERCGARPVEQIHHRRPRRLGGSRRPEVNQPANLLAVCSTCHNEIESNRAEAHRRGQLLSAHATPATLPVHYRGRLVRLSDDSHVIPVEDDSDDHTRTAPDDRRA